MASLVQESDSFGASDGGRIVRQPRVAVIGAGFSGLGLGYRLRAAGLADFTIFEKADRVGGTWRDNRYPGVSCDIPAIYYCFTFAPNPDWSMAFPPGSETQAYIEATASDVGLLEHMEFSTPVTAGRWEEGPKRWHLWSEDRDLGTFDFVITATGFLHYPMYPDIPGLSTFGGEVAHTAQWDDAIEAAGKRVGVIGSGSTGTQVVGAITDEVSELHHFMRTPQWMVPMENFAVSEEHKRELREQPALMRYEWEQMEKLQDDIYEGFTEPGPSMDAFKQMPVDFLEAAVPDPELRAQLTPDYPVGCRRLIVSTKYYEMIQRPNANLIRSGISEIVPEGIVTSDGTLVELDLLIVATGYDTHAFNRHVGLVGREGTTVDELWKDGYRTYETVALEKFPNFFMLGGPHSPFGHFSFAVSGGLQAEYATRWIDAWAHGEFDVAEPKPEAVEFFTERQRAKAQVSTWGQDCVSWYQDVSGTPSLYPWTSKTFRDAMNRRVVSDFAVEH